MSQDSITDVSYDYLFKVLVIGDSNVGKSALILQFTRSQVGIDDIQPTIGVDFRIRSLQLNGKRVKLQIWDAAGAEKFRTLTEGYYRGAAGILIVYDITTARSFENVKYWLAEIDRHVTDLSSTSRMLIGNKCDLKATRQVETQTAEEFALKNNLRLVEASAKTLVHVDKVFETLSSDMVDCYHKQVAALKQQTVDAQQNPTRICAAGIFLSLENCPTSRSSSSCCKS